MSDNLPNDRDEKISESGRSSFLRRGAILTVLLALGALATVKSGCNEEKNPVIDLDNIMLQINKGQITPDGGVQENELIPEQPKPENKRIKRESVKKDTVKEEKSEDSEDDDESSYCEGPIMV